MDKKLFEIFGRIADDKRRLGGLVNLGTLLQAPEAATLTTLMQPPAGMLAAHAPLAATTAHPGWERASLLPVVEPGDRLVGVMTRDALARALRRAAPIVSGDDDARLPLLFARAYWQTLSGLIESGLTLLPRIPPMRPQEEPSHER